MRLLNESWSLGEQADAAQPAQGSAGPQSSAGPAHPVARNPYVHSDRFALGMVFPGPWLPRPQVHEMNASAREFNCELKINVLNRTQRISIIGDSYNK